MTNEDLVRHLAEKNHETWRADSANAKSKYNVPFDDLPEPQKESALNDARNFIDEYEKVMPPKPAEPVPAPVVASTRKPLPPKGPLQSLKDKLNPPQTPLATVEVPAEPQEAPSEPTQTAILPNAPAQRALTPNELLDSALRYIAEVLRALPEGERRRLAGLSIQNVAFNSTNGDYLLAKGLLATATDELPTFFNAVNAQRQNVNP